MRRPPLRLAAQDAAASAAAAHDEAELLKLEALYCSHGDTGHYTEQPKIAHGWVHQVLDLRRLVDQRPSEHGHRPRRGAAFPSVQEHLLGAGQLPQAGLHAAQHQQRPAGGVRRGGQAERLDSSAADRDRHCTWCLGHVAHCRLLASDHDQPRGRGARGGAGQAGTHRR